MVKLFKIMLRGWHWWIAETEVNNHDWVQRPRLGSEASSQESNAATATKHFPKFVADIFRTASNVLKHLDTRSQKFQPSILWVLHGTCVKRAGTYLLLHASSLNDPGDSSQPSCDSDDRGPGTGAMRAAARSEPLLRSHCDEHTTQWPSAMLATGVRAVVQQCAHLIAQRPRRKTRTGELRSIRILFLTRRVNIHITSDSAPATPLSRMYASYLSTIYIYRVDEGRAWFPPAMHVLASTAIGTRAGGVRH